MAFWSSETLKRQIVAERIIEPYVASNVKHGAYELGLGSSVFTTSEGQKRSLTAEDQVAILPGQFALLITEERIRVPTNAIAFISIKAGIKFRGLVNVSGFHVDPGFKGRLKFSVFNAGSKNIVLDRAQRVFLIWFARLDLTTSDTYNGDHLNQDDITSDDVMKIQGDVASPAALKTRLDEVERMYDKRLAATERSVEVHSRLTVALLAAIIVGFLTTTFATLRGCDSQRAAVESSKTPSQVQPVPQIAPSPAQPVTSPSPNPAQGNGNTPSPKGPAQ